MGHQTFLVPECGPQILLLCKFGAVHQNPNYDFQPDDQLLDQPEMKELDSMAYEPDEIK